MPSFLPQLTRRAGTALATRSQPAERREPSRSGPWAAVAVGGAGFPTFLAVNGRTGRNFRIGVQSLADAWAQVDLLNRCSLEITA